jgi:hypothetical protein
VGAPSIAVASAAAKRSSCVASSEAARDEDGDELDPAPVERTRLPGDANALMWCQPASSLI